MDNIWDELIADKEWLLSTNPPRDIKQRLQIEVDLLNDLSERFYIAYKGMPIDFETLLLDTGHD